MDKVVDHLLVFKGNGEIKDFPGNYTQYREFGGEKTEVRGKGLEVREYFRTLISIPNNPLSACV
jgi:ATP-binding cassette subfamily F protein uup